MNSDANSAALHLHRLFAALAFKTLKGIKMKNVIVLLLILLSAVSCNMTKKAQGPTEMVVLN